MCSNYKKDSEIEEEMKNVVIENFLDFDVTGRYEFARCEDCNGPLIGHMKAKCPKLAYDSEDMKKFENYLKRIKGFKEAVWAREKKNREENEKIEIKKAEIIAQKFAESVKLALESKVMPGATPAGTTQLVKTRQPPLWSGEKFDRWKVEVERWHENNNSNDKDEYMDLLESLKKNEVIKDFVVNTLVEKVGTTRTATKILEVMSEKFDKNMGEKTSEMMRKISGEGFRSDENMDKMI